MFSGNYYFNYEIFESDVWFKMLVKGETETLFCVSFNISSMSLFDSLYNFRVWGPTNIVKAKIFVWLGTYFVMLSYPVGVPIYIYIFFTKQPEEETNLQDQRLL